MVGMFSEAVRLDRCAARRGYKWEIYSQGRGSTVRMFNVHSNVFIFAKGA